GRIAAQLATLEAAHIVRPMLGRVPTGAGQIDAAAEGHGPVDDDDFLMQSRTHRAAIVVAKVYAPVRVPAELVNRGRLAASRKHQRVVPGQDVHLERAAALDQEVEKVPENIGHRAAIVGNRTVAHCAEVQARGAVEIPPDDDYRASCEQRGPRESAEIRLSIDEQRSAARTGDPLAVAPGT